MNNNDFTNRHNFGSSPVAENCQKISVNELVRLATKDLKKRLVGAQVEALGISVALTTSKTRFNGERLWFVCPACGKRIGTLYSVNAIIACKKCLALTYKEQRYKGMVELK